MHFVRRVLQPGFGIHYGSNVLQCLMDDSSPGIDLLVREAVQNSLDAAVDGAASVRVEFNYSELRVGALDGILDAKTVESLIRLHGDTKTALCIRDIGSVGLSGPNSFAGSRCEDYGNFLKLCFSVGLKQSKEGSGGSWGFGKSIFYRLSHAPVLYYSRFLQDGDFRERLIFCLIEDQDNRAQCVVDAGAGLAWWGDYDQDTNSIIPCEVPERIYAVLEKLELPRYLGDETGTLIFLPCLREGQVPKSPSESGNSEDPEWISLKYTELEQYKRYTSIAIQRWYSPRLCGGGYVAGPMLQASVNGLEVGSENDPLLPFFSLIQKLYAFAVRNEADETDLKGKARLIPLQLRSTFADGDTSPGVFAVVRLPHGHSLLNGFGQDYPDHEVQAFNFKNLEESRKRPMIAMVRKPGMIVAYRNSGEWVDDIAPDPQGCHLVGIFVLRSDARMSPDYPDTLLEEYIRHREPPSHNDWVDGRGCNGRTLNLLMRLKVSIAKGVNRAYYSKAIVPTDKSGFMLGDIIADRYFPAGFSPLSKRETVPRIKWYCPEHPGIRKVLPGFCLTCGSILEQQRVKNQGGSGGPKITIVGQRFPAPGIIVVETELSGGSARSVILEVMVASDGAAVSRKAWEEGIGTSFPIELSELYLHDYKCLEKAESNGDRGDGWASLAPSDSVPYISPVLVTVSRECGTAHFEFKTPNILIRASITMERRDSGVRPVLAIREAGVLEGL